MGWQMDVRRKRDVKERNQIYLEHLLTSAMIFSASRDPNASQNRTSTNAPYTRYDIFEEASSRQQYMKIVEEADKSLERAEESGKHRFME